MKRFIKNLLIFVIIVLTIIMTLNSMYVKRRKSNMDKFANIPDTVQVCNFGPSYGEMGFNYEDFESKYDCFNFGLGHQHLSYDYRLFQYYGDHIVEGSIVFIPVSYHIIFGQAENCYDSFASYNKRYYSILPKSLIKDFSYQTYIYVKYFPILVDGTNQFIMTMLGKSEDADKTWQRVSTDIDIEEEAVDRFYRQIGSREYFYDDDGNRIENQEEIDALYALVRGCQAKGAIPILITMPSLHEYTDMVKENAPDFYDHFYSVVDRVVQETGVEYYDYAFDERFVNEYSWFVDTGHLNKVGARNLTNIVMEEIVYANGYLDK